MDIEIDFQHNTSSNCETGVMRNLMDHNGFHVNEDLLFGIGSGLYFIYVPFVKMGETEPLTSYRYSPGSILKNAAKHLGVTFQTKKFANADEGMRALDEKLAAGTVVGLTGDLYYFEVFPEFLNFHFPAHNLVVYGKRGNTYLVSDPIVEDKVEISEENMRKARFTNMPGDPKGKMYWLQSVGVKSKDLRMPIKKGLTTTCKRMLNPFFPFGGVKGINLLAKRLEKYPQKKTQDFASKHLINMIRHQEIVGSGGSGYRKQFARFLFEAAKVTNYGTLKDFGDELMEDLVVDWRDYAVDMGRCSRQQITEIPEKYRDLAANLRRIATKEKSFFERLKKASVNL